METATIQIRMLGEFSLVYGDQTITDNDNRSRKVWLLLAYMIYCRKHSISQDELFSLLWDEEEGSSNPVNALKTIFHRVRTMLDGLGCDMGRTLIIRRGGNYCWNSEVPFTFDVEDFEALCKAASSQHNPQRKLDAFLSALELYQGDFLSKLSSEPWVVPLNAYFHNLFLQTVRSTLPMLLEAGRTEEAVALSRRSIRLEPYDEDLYRFLMQAQLNLGDQRGAISTYEAMSELLFSNFGIMPSDESKALWREASRMVNDVIVDLGSVREHLQEDSGPGGALVCEYDFFQAIYRAESRSVARSGIAVHIALISVSGEKQVLPKRSLECSMTNLLELIRSSLRKGDVVSRCSISQYIMLLPQANYENSCMVCERIVKAFARQYPHSPARLHYSVQPLEPYP